MCKIIQFPIEKVESNGYKNLIGFFEVCETVESCNFYLEVVENLFNDGNITEKEMYTLRRIGRQKRLELATPKQKATKAENPGTYLYTPEMGQQKPENCDIEAGLCYYGKHYWLKTKLDLKGRGITKNESSRDGYNEYTVTALAFSKLKEKYKIAYESVLD